MLLTTLNSRPPKNEFTLNAQDVLSQACFWQIASQDFWNNELQLQLLKKKTRTEQLILGSFPPFGKHLEPDGDVGWQTTTFLYDF